MSTAYLDLARGPETRLRLELERFKGRDLLNLRTWWQGRPTKKGIAIAPQDVPAVRAALEAAETDLLARGLIEIEDYTNAGLPLPAQLQAPTKRKRRTA
jgi:hypothetical protein